MAQPLILKVCIVEQKVTKVMQFPATSQICDTCQKVRNKITDSNLGQAKDYGLFLPGEEGHGIWLETDKELQYYCFKDHDLIEYRRKIRPLKVRMLDGMVKTLMVDDSQPVSKMMVVVCTKIGLMNHEEYSLVHGTEEEFEDNKYNYSTLTLKKKKENPKKKIRTDDDINWVDNSKTLREQGISENEVLLMKKKYFFSDGNIDSQDPIQLNLLYVQCRDGILDGTNPVTQDKACEFAGIQCQIQFGDYNENKHKSGFLDLKEFLPHDYIRALRIEKKIFNQHKLMAKNIELEAKLTYVTLARALKTYGVSFFLVKEKQKGRNKLVPRLLGITKDSILRLDEKTKEIMKTWPLTTVKRWTATHNTCTLDFGDYADQYYPFQTPEADQISQLISGYIEIILKAQRQVDYLGIDGDEGQAVQEDSVHGLKPSIIEHWTKDESQAVTEYGLAQSGILTPGVKGAQTLKSGSLKRPIQQENTDHSDAYHVQMVQQPKVSKVDMSKPQQALCSTIENGQSIIDSCIGDLDKKVDLHEMGTDHASVKWKQVTLDTNKHIVTSQIAAMNAATAEVVTLNSGSQDEVDHASVESAIYTITTNLPQVTTGVKMIAALLDNDKDSNNLLQANKYLCSSFTNLLTATNPEMNEPREKMIKYAGEVGEASKVLLTNIDDNQDEETEDILLDLSESVVKATAKLIQNTKEIASQSSDKEVKQKLMYLARNSANATAQLVACTKVLVPTTDNASCKIQLIEAVKEVGRSIDNMIQVTQESTNDEELLSNLTGNAIEAREAHNDFINYIKTAGDPKGNTILNEEAIEAILMASERIFTRGTSGEMVNQAKVLTKATTELISSIQSEASALDNYDQKNQLFAFAKVLTDATSKVVEAAKECLEYPNDNAKQEKLIGCADNVRIAAYLIAGNALKKKTIEKLQNASKHATATATQCLTAAQGAGDSNTSKMSQEELLTNCKLVSDIIPNLVSGVKSTMNAPESPKAQNDLINSCSQLLQPGTQMISSAKSALPTITDQKSSMQLSKSVKQFSQALADLRTSLGNAQQACGSLEIDNAVDTIQTLDSELLYLKDSANDGSVKPLPGETPESTAQYFNNCCKTLSSTVAQLLTAATQGNKHFTDVAVRDTSQALTEFVSSVRGIVANTDDTMESLKFIDAARVTMAKFIELIEETKLILQIPEGTASRQKMINAGKEVSNAINETINCLPGQKDIDETIKKVTEYSINLNPDDFPKSNKSYKEAQNELTIAATEFNEASSQIAISARKSSQHLATTSKNFMNHIDGIIGIGMEISGSINDEEICDNIIDSMKNVTSKSSKFLASAKLITADPDSANAKNQLQLATRALMESINNLIDICNSSAPGQKECESAIRAIKSMTSLLEQSSDLLTDATYYDCLENVTSCSKTMADGMANIATHAKNLDNDKFGNAIKGVSTAMCSLVESAAQAAYYVGISDQSSSAGKPGIIDQSLFSNAHQLIKDACNTLNDPKSDQQQVLSAATIIARNTGGLCNNCRTASSKTNNPVAKRHFVQSAKDVADATSNLVKEIKMLEQDNSGENKSRCRSFTQPLLEAVENLCNYANTPEFSAVSAKISTKAREAQKPIILSGKSIIAGSCNMIEASKSLTVNPKDPPTWKALTSHSKNVSDNIKILISALRDKAPGQRECEGAVDLLNINIGHLDQASLSAIDDNLPQSKHNNLVGYNEQVATASQALLSSIEKVRVTAKCEAENLGHAISQMSTYFTPLVNASIGCASNMSNSKRQACFLDQTKSVLECALQLMYAAKESGGNPKAIHAHPEVEESADSMKVALQDLLANGESIAVEAGVVSGLIESITLSINKCTENTPVTVDEHNNFADYQTRMVTSAKEIMKHAHEMVSKSSIDSSQLSNLSANLSHEYNKLASDSLAAIQLSTSPEMSNIIRTSRTTQIGTRKGDEYGNENARSQFNSSIHEVGQGCIRLVKCGATCQVNPKDTYCKRELAESARHLGENIASFLVTLKETSQGTQACINAASTVSGIIGDLDTTIMFASAGTLSSDNEAEVFSSHKNIILQTAKNLVKDTRTLVEGADSSQEQLASAANNAVTTIVSLSEVVKNGAASLGPSNEEGQVSLMNAVRDVAMALGDLIQSTKSASGKPVDDPAITGLKDSAKVMIKSVSLLLQTVKTVENVQTRGTHALESTIEAIGQEIKSFNMEEDPVVRSTPEELIRSTKPITIASAKAVCAGMSMKQEDAIVAANFGRKSVSQLLSTCKATAWGAENKEMRISIMTTGLNTAIEYKELLQLVLTCMKNPTTQSKDSLPIVSKKIAESITNLVSVTEEIKGSEWEDPEDPTVIAENELLDAAKSIEAAAKKLEILRPRKAHTKDINEDMQFEDIILDACKSIAAATGALIKAACHAQQELVEAGKVNRSLKSTSNDGQWSEGLVSAARHVAAATQSLCEAANSLVQGNASEEKLIASAKQVAAYTAQLLVACRIKADPNSQTTKRLQEAGNKVKKATDALVKSAQQVVDHEEESTLVMAVGTVSGMKQGIEMKENIERLMRELQKAREEQDRMNKMKARKSTNLTNEPGLPSEKPSPNFKSNFNMNIKPSSPTDSINIMTNLASAQSRIVRKNTSSFKKKRPPYGPQGEITQGPSFGEAMTTFRNRDSIIN